MRPNLSTRLDALEKRHASGMDLGGLSDAELSALVEAGRAALGGDVLRSDNIFLALPADSQARVAAAVGVFLRRPH